MFLCVKEMATGHSRLAYKRVLHVVLDHHWNIGEGHD